MLRRLQTRQIEAVPAEGMKTLESTCGIEFNKRGDEVGELRILIPKEEAKGSEVAFSFKANHSFLSSP